MNIIGNMPDGEDRVNTLEKPAHLMSVRFNLDFDTYQHGLNPS
jgi:hypothetical protein